MYIYLENKFFIGYYWLSWGGCVFYLDKWQGKENKNVKISI